MVICAHCLHLPRHCLQSSFVPDRVRLFLQQKNYIVQALVETFLQVVNTLVENYRMILAGAVTFIGLNIMAVTAGRFNLKAKEGHFAVGSMRLDAWS